jgi:transcription initiation factor IIE alpha subunit
MSKPLPLVTRLRAALRVLKRDRLALYESERCPPDNTVDADAQEWLLEYDDAIAALGEAIRKEAA